MSRMLQGIGTAWGLAAMMAMAWWPMGGTATATSPPVNPNNQTADHSRPVALLMKAPLSFEANHGQVDDQVKFLARGNGYTLFLTPTESVMVLSRQEANASIDDRGEEFLLSLTFDPSRPDANTQAGDRTVVGPPLNTDPTPIRQSIVRMKLEGANSSPAIDGMEQLPGIVNYFIGNDPGKWRTKIPTYAKVHYKETYPGIDLAYYGSQGKLEYDFIVAPGADPSQIKLAFEGASDIQVAESGDLLLTTTLGEVRVQKPIVYQLEKGGHKTLVAGNYVLQPGLTMASSSQGSEKGNGTLLTAYEVGIQLAAYDHDKTLVIDPVLTYSSYLGGALGEESRNRAIAADSSGNAYITGSTASVDFPIAGTPFQGASAGFNAFITKINPTGSALIYSTYLGGLGNTIPYDLDVDALGNVYLAGSTSSPNFPVTPGSVQTVRASTTDAFVTKLNSSGSGLLYSTFLGGNGDEIGTSIAIDTSGRAFVGGWTVSTNFPNAAASPFQSTLAGGRDAFWSVINPAGNAIVMSSYYGGSLNDEAQGIAVDSVGTVYITGTTLSSNLFGVNLASLQPSIDGVQDAFVASFNTGTSTLVYSTYLGGSGSDGGADIVVNGSGASYITGATRSNNFPLAGSPAQPVLGGNADAFVVKLNSSGSSLIYSTFLGVGGDDFGSGIAVDSAGNAYVSGGTRSLTWPGASGSSIQSSNAGFADAFVTKLNSTGTSVLFSTFLGGSLDDNARGIALDGNGNIYVAGDTKSSNFHTQSPFQAAFAGGADAWVAKITDKPIDNAGPLTANVVATPNPASVSQGILLSAMIDDGTTGGSNIASANYEIRDSTGAVVVGGAGDDFNCAVPTTGSLCPNQPVFDQVQETVTASIGTLPTAVYDLCVQGTDEAGNVGALECAYLVIYDPNGQFVTGGGWIQSEGGYCTLTALCEGASGKAHFGFVSKYKKGATVPSGETQFEFKAGDFKFHSTEYDWLVVGGSQAQFKGSGTINGVGDYGFILTSKDSAINGGPPADTFRIKIWDKANGETVVYDNGTNQPLGGGSIVIH